MTAKRVEDKIRLAAREVVGFSAAGVKLSLEDIGEIYTRYGIQSNEEAFQTGMEIKEMGRELIEDVVRRSDLGIVGKALVAKYNLRGEVIVGKERLRSALLRKP